MCIVFFIFGHPKYKLIIASNRDESLKRPTQAANYWDIDNNIISAIDLATVTHINKPNKDLNNAKSTKLKRRSLPSTINSYEKQLLNEILNKNNNGTRSSLSESLNRTCDSIPENLEKNDYIKNIYKTEKKISGYGSWLGCSRQGLFSVITNFREDPKSLMPNAISRGYLVRDFLLLKSLYYKNNNIKQMKCHQKNTSSTTSTPKKIRMHHPMYQVPEKVLNKFKEEDKQYAMEDALDKKETNDDYEMESLDNGQIDFPYEYMKYVDKNKNKYNGFNLIVGDISLPEPSVWYIGNKGYASTEKLKKNTVYGMSNGSLNTYWKKVERGKKLFKRAVENHTDLNDLCHKLLNVLSDKKDIPMDKLPKTAFEPKLEKCCAPICIEKERFNNTIYENDYATKTHTVIVIDNNDHVTFIEQDQYDTISNNYVMKQKCYVYPPLDNVNYLNTSSSVDSSSNVPFYGYMPSGRTMTMPINIPRQRKSSYGSSFENSFHKSYTTLTPEFPLYYSPINNNIHNSFDNIFHNHQPRHHSISNTPISLSSVENIAGDVIASPSLSTSNSSSRVGYLFNTAITSSPSSNTNSSFPNLMTTDIHYHSNRHTISSGISNKKNKYSDFEEEDDDDDDDEKNQNINDHLEDELDNIKLDTYINSTDTIGRIDNLSSCTPISSSVFNFFESITSNDYKDKINENQYVKRNVNDFSKANIHQFNLKF
ncbi:hypothetical protein BCR36DRAFT_294648 [Piromyces finnis]|uniref:DUF833-domain-containing protein n=1 Tax=Piromyces finnis TaxID=1754191 RepID=A0A1Y1V6Y5_9FUNG|nr:hypothetical protein BCR36DRAFT_294648 [Piromyces finnis]|eukprot:ORX47914.1 hypothetical protein BCR36DRAFT_294648 [Piromyces finnis]